MAASRLLIAVALALIFDSFASDAWHGLRSGRIRLLDRGLRDIRLGHNTLCVRDWHPTHLVLRPWPSVPFYPPSAWKVSHLQLTGGAA